MDKEFPMRSTNSINFPKPVNVPERAFVTGGRAGIGMQIVLLLAANGCDVVTWSRRPCDKLLEEAARLNLPGKITTFEVDITNRALVLKTLDEMKAGNFSTLDLLVNCAGISHIYKDPSAYVPGISASEWMEHANLVDKMVYTNLIAPILITTRCVALGMLGRGSSIVSITSIAGSDGGQNAHLGYTGAKAGMNGVTKQWSKQYGPLGIRCNAIAPGTVDGTEITDGLTDEQKIPMVNSTLIKRLVTASDIAKTVLYLAGQEGMTGQVVNENGGAIRVG